MSNRNFLLTYEKNGASTYAWLETEKEMNDLIAELLEDEGAIIHDKLEIYQAREIE
ncbi:hypothetical protein NDS46_29940 (plasmid) [Paenibacillus thiaminolyticus]|uniref:hypothetical protein n=1 Tax=Paenibacillus thiaminolyticus TaxID=49283 RepID=UPI00232AA81D|nr:hypothetical protein [Paenibacillus thiaminolyticus]WCF11570.1 hypothetical protein NDS46_29940 [Paenibacillus thiaminolyticus]